MKPTHNKLAFTRSLWAIVLLLFVPHIQSQSVEIVKDPFSGTSTVWADLGSQKEKVLFFPKSVYLKLIAYPYPRSPRYQLIASLVRENWAFISSGESLIFKLDGQFMPLTSRQGSSPSRDVITGYLGGVVSESAVYELTHEQLMRLGNAKEKSFRLVGKKDIFTSTLNEQADQAIKSLLGFLPPGGAPWTILNNQIVPVGEYPQSTDEENLILPPLTELNISAKAGDREAQYLLGNAFRYGKGVRQDIPMSVKLFGLAADQGHPMAQYKMGTASILGIGVSQDSIRAHMWFNLAADQGVELAKKTRDMIESQMTPQQITQAQELAKNWKPKKK